MMTYDEILQLILAAGSDSLHVFGGLYEGGYRCQQVPYEISSAINVLQDREYHSYIEIGAAAGGTTRFLTDCIKIGDVAIIDDNQHSGHTLRCGNLNALKNTGNLREWVGNSHSLECKQFLQYYNHTFDFALIDGDHCYSGVKQDIELLLPYLENNAVVMLHDTDVVPDIRILFAEMREGLFPQLTFLFNFVNAQSPNCGLGAFINKLES